MRDGRNRLLLPRCCSAEKRACRNKEDIVQASVLQLTQDFCTQYRCAAAAARTARMNVLRLSVKYHHPAIAVVRADINVLLQEKLSQIAAAYQSQITREYQIIISRLCLRIAKISRYGVRRSRCCCQDGTMNLLISIFWFYVFSSLILITIRDIKNDVVLITRPIVFMSMSSVIILFDNDMFSASGI